MPDSAATKIHNTLESTFNSILQQRMADVPIIHHTLKPQAIDFRPYNNHWLGIMITPWFMNLMLLPGENQDWSNQTELSEITQRFPSGRYTFIAGFEPGIGHYQSCSLFSPMFEFTDQQAAVKTAHTILQELMNEKNIDSGDINQHEVKTLWDGDPPTDDKTTSTQPENQENKAPANDQPSLSERMQQPISRRDLLRGSFIRDNQK